MSEVESTATSSQRKQLDTTPASLEFLSKIECASVSQIVHDLRNYWELTDRHPYYRLGAVSYLDLAGGTAFRYYALAKRMNPILREKFGWLYERLSDVLARHLGIPVHFTPDAALPGFHIYLAHQETQGRKWNIHWDGHTKWVRFNGSNEADYDSTISLTAAIALPKSGAGLNMWDVKHSPEASDGIQERLESMPHQFYSYKLGHVFVHSGEAYHQIANMRNIGPTDERITLQAHAVQLPDKIIMYW